MISLIKNEILKIFKKKSIYVMLIVTFAFVLLINVLYKFVVPKLMNISTYDYLITSSMEQEMKNLNLNNPEEALIYVTDKTYIDQNELLKKYDTESWQYSVIQEKGYDLIYQVNYFTYKEKDEENLENAQNDYNKFIEEIEKGDWKQFAKEELEFAKQSKNLVEDDEQKETADLQIEGLQMRLDYDIEYGNNFKNQALANYLSGKIQIKELENKNNKTYKEKKEYQELKELIEINKYAIEKNVDIINEDNTRGILLKIFSEYELFIIITVVLIAGTIVSEEFNKGTIKLLLVRPYSRNKILFAKFIAVLFTIVFIIIAITVMQFIIGLLFYGASSLKIPQIIYNHNTGKIEENNLALAILKECLGRFPLYVLIGTLAFSISAMLNNTAVAITVSLLGYMSSNIINQITYNFNVKWIKYFVTPNWDLTQMFNGKLHSIEGISILFSITICLIYFAVLIIPSFIVFKKKNIKNI